MDYLSFCCENDFLIVPSLLIFLYFGFNFIIDHWISTDVKKNILITGCDSGFGLATALELSQANCKVYAGCLTQNGVERLQNDERFQGMAFIMDVTKDEDVEKAKKVIENDGCLDGIVNNAGIAIHGLIEWQSIDLMKKTFEVNYWGMIRVTKVMLPLLKKSRGRIVNLTSMGGRASLPYTAPYFASKFAAEAFSDSLRFEVKPWGISVHIIEPTFYQTGILNEENIVKDWYKIWDKQPQEIKDEFEEDHLEPFVRATFRSMKITPDVREVSALIKHALRARFPRRRYITGIDSKLMAFVTHLPTVAWDFILSLKMPVLRPKDTKKCN